MKENVIDVLMFLFDNYLSYEEGMPGDEESLATELEEAGFHSIEINKAFDWLGELAEIQKTDFTLIRIPSVQSMRAFLPQEAQKLDIACRGFIFQLEQIGLLDTATRELIIDRAMAIDVEQLSLQQFKRIVGLVMLNSGTHEEMLAWIEDLIYEEMGTQIH
jgi:Smg protein